VHLLGEEGPLEEEELTWGDELERRSGVKAVERLRERLPSQLRGRGPNEGRLPGRRATLDRD
jgi:hypothetical protein